MQVPRSIHGSFVMKSSFLRSLAQRMSRVRTRFKSSDHRRPQQNDVGYRSVAQVSSSSHATHPVHDADLELRLGRSGADLVRPSPRRAGGGTHRPKIHKTATIDLTSGSDDERVIGGTHITKIHKTAIIDLTSASDDEPIIYSSRKRKATQNSPEASKDVQLSCSICMDVMKEEASTICGHIFCRPCILRAIQAQKKCPTCRRKLSTVNIHRIYLPKGTR